MRSWLIRNVFTPLHEKFSGLPVHEKLRALEASQWWAGEQIREWQWQKAKELLAHAYQNIPYYKKLLDERGLPPHSIQTWEDWKKIPILSRQTAHDEMTHLMARDKVRKLIRKRTSGTQGERVDFFWDKAAYVTNLAMKLRGHRWFGIDTGDSSAKLWDIPPRTKPLSRLKNYLRQTFLRHEIGLPIRDLSEEKLEKFYGEVQRLQPVFLVGYRSALTAFADFIQKTGKDGRALGVRFVLSTAEMMLPYQRKKLQEIFGAPVGNVYGANEVGLLGFECPQGAMHLMADGVLIEFIPEDPASDVKTVIATNLENYGMPLLRYRIGDVASPVERPCSCGRGLPAVDLSVARLDEVIELPNGRRFHVTVLASVIEYAFPYGENPIREFCFYQTASRDFKLQVAGKFEDKELVRKRIIENSRKYLGPNIIFEIEFVPKIEKPASSKMRSVIRE